MIPQIDQIFVSTHHSILLLFQAISLTQENADALNLSSRLSTQLRDIVIDPPSQTVDMIVSNPPYIPSSDLLALERELDYEDPLALDGGLDGLDIAKEIINWSPKILPREGSLWLELDDGHPRRVDMWLDSKEGCRFRAKMEHAEAFSDLGGRERFVRLTRGAGY